MEKKTPKKAYVANRKWAPESIRKVYQELNIPASSFAAKTKTPFEKFSLIKYVETVYSASNLGTRS